MACRRNRDPRSSPITLLLLASTMLAMASGFLPPRTTEQRSSTAIGSAAPVAVAPPQAVPSRVKEAWGIDPGANFALGGSDSGGSAPPILEIPNFLTAAECAHIRNWAQHSIENGADECDDYLNYRVNQEIEEGANRKKAER